MKGTKINDKKIFIFILILCVLAVVIIIAFKVRGEYEPPETTGGLEDRKLDSDVKKLFEADSDSAGDYEVFLFFCPELLCVFLVMSFCSCVCSQAVKVRMSRMYLSMVFWDFSCV